MHRWKNAAYIAFAACSLTLTGTVGAQGDKVIRILVPFSAGGGADSAARTIARHLQTELGQPVIVENKPGAGGNIAFEQVAKSEKDGLTLALATNSLVINPLLYATTTRFDPLKSFVPVASVARSPVVLVARLNLPISSVAELIAHARANPGKLSYASCGNGSIHQLAGEALKSQATMFITHVPYKGCSNAMTDVAGGQVDLGMISLTTAGSFIDSKKVKAIAVTAANVSALLPSVPTVASAGLKGYAFDGWYGLVAAVGTPDAVVKKLNAAVNKALMDVDVRKSFATGSLEAAPGTPAEYGAFLERESATYARIIKSSGIKED